MKFKPASGAHIMLTEWQIKTFEHEYKPTEIERKEWLKQANAYNNYNMQILALWDATRFHREFLNDKHITEWLEFYFT